jgi:hypothetical protein
VGDVVLQIAAAAICAIAILGLLLAVVIHWPRFKRLARLRPDERVLYVANDTFVSYALSSYLGGTAGVRLLITDQRLLEFYREDYPLGIVNYDAAETPPWLWPLPSGSVLSVPTDALTFGTDSRGEFLEVRHKRFGKRYYCPAMGPVRDALRRDGERLHFDETSGRNAP